LVPTAHPRKVAARPTLIISHNEALVARLHGNIGYPKLFPRGAVGRRKFPAAPTGNNFAAAPFAAAGSGWPSGFISAIR